MDNRNTPARDSSNALITILIIGIVAILLVLFARSYYADPAASNANMNTYNSQGTMNTPSTTTGGGSGNLLY